MSKHPFPNFEGLSPLSFVVKELVPQSQPGLAKNLHRALTAHVEGVVQDYVSKAVSEKLVDGLLKEDELVKKLMDRLEALRQTGAAQDFPGLAAAVAEGDRLKESVLSSPEMLSSDEAAKRMGISRETLNSRRRKSLVAVERDGKRGYRYPSWQFSQDVYPFLGRILKNLAHLDDWNQYLFLVEPEPLLGGQTPLQMLRLGHVDSVVSVAQKMAAETHGERFD